MQISYNNYIDKIINSRTNCAEFMKVPVNIQARVFLFLPQHIQKNILQNISEIHLLKLLKYPAPDDVTDIIQKLSYFKRKKILDKLETELREKVSYLLKYPEDTAAGMMDLNYVLASVDLKFKDLANIVEKHKNKTGKDPVVLVEENGVLLGELSATSFILNSPSKEIKNNITKIPVVKYNEKHSKVFKLFEHNKNNKIVVLDSDNSIMGIIYAHDIYKLVKKQRTKDMYDFAGLKQEEDIFDSFYLKFKNRCFWLVINLFTAFLASLVVAIFRDVISAVVMLAAYMPIVAGMGGNAGTQTLAVTVRGLALHNLKTKALSRIYFNELVSAFLIGLVVGAFAIVLAYVLNASLIFGVIVAVSVLANLLVAATVGFFIPVLLKKLGKDPATSSSIFITTFTDVLGFFVFLGLATLIFL